MIKSRKRHRLDGPAVVYKHNDKFNYPRNNEFWISGIPYTEKQYWLHPLVIQKTLDDILSND